MRLLNIAIAMILTASVGLADFLTPLADLPIGTNATGKITLLATNLLDTATTHYMANLFTDSGPRTYPVVLPPDVNPSDFIGNECLIDAVIEADDTTEWQRRFRITKIELNNSKRIMEETNSLLVIEEDGPPHRSNPPWLLCIIFGSGYIGLLGYLSMLALIVFAIVSIIRMAYQPKGDRNPSAFLGFAHVQFLFFLLTNGIYALATPTECCGGGSPFYFVLFWYSQILAPLCFEFAFLLFSVFTLCSMSRKWPKPTALTITATFIAVLDLVLFFIIFILLTLPIQKSM
jgi:hypothetical protein